MPIVICEASVKDWNENREEFEKSGLQWATGEFWSDEETQILSYSTLEQLKFLASRTWIIRLMRDKIFYKN